MALKSSDRGPNFHGWFVYPVKVFRLNSHFHVFDRLLYRSPCFEGIFVLLCPQRRSADTQTEHCDESREAFRYEFKKLLVHIGVQRGQCADPSTMLGVGEPSKLPA